VVIRPECKNYTTGSGRLEDSNNGWWREGGKFADDSSRLRRRDLRLTPGQRALAAQAAAALRHGTNQHMKKVDVPTGTSSPESREAVAEGFGMHRVRGMSFVPLVIFMFIGAVAAIFIWPKVGMDTALGSITLGEFLRIIGAGFVVLVALWIGVMLSDWH